MKKTGDILRVKVKAYADGVYVGKSDRLVRDDGAKGPMFEDVGEMEVTITWTVPDPTGRAEWAAFNAACRKNGWISHYRTMGDGEWDRAATVWRTYADQHFFYNRLWEIMDAPWECERNKNERTSSMN